MLIKKNTTQDKVVPVEVIESLCAGSYEELVADVNFALQANKAQFVERADTDISVLATFTDHFIALSSDGDLFKIKMESGNNGVSLTLLEKIEAPVIDRRNSSKYSSDYLTHAIKALTSGNLSESVSAIENFMAVKEHFPVSSNQEIANQIVESIVKVNNRYWRTVLSNNREEIVSNISQYIESINSNGFNVKYTALYDGTIPEEKFEEHREVVVSDLSIISDKLENIHTQAEAAFYPFVEILSESEIPEEEQEVIENFVSFSEDFISEMEELREHVADMLSDAKCVMCLGQVYDAVAENLKDLEIASKFILNMTNSLSGEASK